MQITTPEDVQPHVAAEDIAEFVQTKFGPRMEIDHMSDNEFCVSNPRLIAANVLVGETVEIIGRFPIKGVCQIPLCHPNLTHLIVEQLRKWMVGDESALN